MTRACFFLGCYSLWRRAASGTRTRERAIHIQVPRQTLVEVADDDLGTVTVPNVIPRFSATPGGIRFTGPAPGEHNLEVFGGLLGLEAAELEALRADAVI